MDSKSILRAVALSGFLLAVGSAQLYAAPPSTTFRIAGIIIDSVTGQPLEGAEVTIASVANSDEQQTFLTPSDGHFLFVSLPRGKYRLLASRRGYANQALYQHEGFSTGIAVGPGLDSEHIRFPLAPSSVITGVVSDEWGDPVRDAKVLLFQQNMFDGSHTLSNVNQTITNDQGRYRFAHLLSSTYAVAVYARPWYTQSHGQYDSFTTKQPETISSGDTVVDSVSQPSSATQNPLFDVVYPVTFFPGATTLAEAGRLVLAHGATETADFHLRAVPSVHLRVRVPVGPPITVKTAVEEVDSEGNWQETSSNTSEVEWSADLALSLKIGEGYTDVLEPTRAEIAPGLIELSGIPPGEINLAAASLQGWILGPQGISYVARTKTLTVSGDTEVDFSSRGEPANVSGVVLSSQFHPASTNEGQAPADQSSPGQAALARAMEAASSNVTITFRSPKTGESYDATVSSEGKFSFANSTLSAGSYEAEFPAQSGLRIASLRATGATVSGHTIEIPSGQPVSLVVHTAEAKCSLSGFALKNGKPIAGVMVLLVPQDPGHGTSLYHRDQSDSDGSFLMSPLFPGRYTLLAIENGWDLEWSDPGVLFRFLPAGQPIELQPGASLTLNAKVQ
jgi:5-hydroxyisourate hydrolase-like protein (transthyretin family)